MDDHIPSDRFDKTIFLAMAIVLIVLVACMISNLRFQYRNYEKGIETARDTTSPHQVDHAALLSYSRAWDFAVVETSALFLSYLLMFTGAIYVLRVSKSDFQLSAEKGDFKGHLTTSSPGLVMMVLGAFLVIGVLMDENAIKYDREISVEQREYEEIIEGDMRYEDDVLIKRIPPSPLERVDGSPIP